MAYTQVMQLFHCRNYFVRRFYAMNSAMEADFRAPRFACGQLLYRVINSQYK